MIFRDGDYYITGFREGVRRANEKEVNELLPIAEDVLRAILRWYVTAIKTFKSQEEIIKKLDEALVEGGGSWAYGNPSEGNWRLASNNV